MSNAPRRILVSSLAVIAAIAPAAAGAAPSGSAPTGCAHGPGTSLAVTQSYRLLLEVGMPEKMYTLAEVRRLQPKTGEVMLSGSMSPSGMSMGSKSAPRHLEVQICARKTGAVITAARPSITVDDAMGMATHVSVAKMRGVLDGVAGIHYGNNVKLPLGQTLKIRVALLGETIVFRWPALRS